VEAALAAVDVTHLATPQQREAFIDAYDRVGNLLIARGAALTREALG
jgi:hypothetical protein